EGGIRDGHVTGVQTCALPISACSTRSRAPWAILRTAEGPVLDRPDQVAMVCGGLALDLTPLLVAQERSPRGIPRRLVRPLEQIEIGRASCRERGSHTAAGG